MNYIEELKRYIPINDQEGDSKRVMLEYYRMFPDTILTRECTMAHVSASSMILNEDCTKVLMIYHNIYNSWGWTGGHADGQEDMLQVALKEAEEETGVSNIRLLKEDLWGIDVLPVWGHYKRGKYVGSHMHLNYTYLFQADENQKLRIKEDENSGVMWIEIKELKSYVREDEMMPIYQKLLREYIQEDQL